MTTTGPHQQPVVWVFNGIRTSLPSGVFSSRERAHAWIAHYRLSGVLTCYPLDESIYDWSIRMGHFSPRKPDERAPSFIQGFTGGGIEHYHYDNGSCQE